MRMLPWISLASVLLLACGSGSGSGDDDGSIGGVDASDEQPAASFRMVSTDIEIAAGDERTYCYYTTVELPRDVGVKKWSSVMSAGSHHLIVFAADSSIPDGTMTEDCDLGGGGGVNLPVSPYGAQTPENSLAMPAGVGMTVKAGQKMVLQMHYFNPTGVPITAHVEVTGEYYDDGVEYIPAASFASYNTEISIPAGVGQTASVSGSCAVPDTAKFFTISTHAHRRATLTRVTDGGEMVFESDDWEHPMSSAWAAEPFYQFTGNLDYRCEYVNDLSQSVQDGGSAATDEMCMATGYFFPATESMLCINSFVIP